MELDITRETCPMTFVKVRLALAKLPAGEKLVVRLSEGEPLENVPRSCEEAGFRVLAKRPNGDGTWTLEVAK